MAVMEEMSAVWQEVDHPSGATLEEFFDVQVSLSVRPTGRAVLSVRRLICLPLLLLVLLLLEAKTKARQRSVG